jgi:hypothetical protein
MRERNTAPPAHRGLAKAALLALATATAGLGATGAAAQDGPWQNPFMAPNPYNNIHNDAWFTDTYQDAGPENANAVQKLLISKLSFLDPDSGAETDITLGNCAAQTYDSSGNLIAVCSGYPDQSAEAFIRHIVALSPDGDLLAYRSYEAPYSGSLADAIKSFGGIGYFYLDADENMVLGMPDGFIRVFAREDSDVSDVDLWRDVRAINITGTGGPLNPLLVGDLYALVPAENGYIWFTTTGGGVGTVAPTTCISDCVRWLDVNDPDGDGNRAPQPDGGFQKISESHSVNLNAMYQQTDYKMYRFDMEADGTPSITWEIDYDRGTGVKPGQTSRGSGTSPSFFKIGDREFVTIMDNATRPNINIYRAEDSLEDDEAQLFAQAAPFGQDTRVSNENSLIAFTDDGSGTARIYAENNWGNNRLISTAGPLVTRPGFGGVEVAGNGDLEVLPPNVQLRIPSVVSKGSIVSNALYTYNKQRDGWYLTAVDADDPTNQRWSVLAGSTSPSYNNWYAQLSLSPDNETFFIGVAAGVLKVKPVVGTPAPRHCFALPEIADFLDVMEELASYTSGPVVYDEYLEAAFRAWRHEFGLLTRLPDLSRSELRSLRRDLTSAQRLLDGKDYLAADLTPLEKVVLGDIAGRHDSLLAEAEQVLADDCAVSP